MPMTRTQKQVAIESTKSTLSEAEVVILVHNKGLTVAEVSKLRTQMREAGAHYRVVKNRLIKLAVKDTRYEHLNEMLTGPTALATSVDPIAAAKVVVDFAKTNDRLVVVGGAFGEKLLDVKSVEHLAKMPSLDQLRGQLVGLLQTPAQRIASVLQAPGGQLARVFSAYSQKE